MRKVLVTGGTGQIGFCLAKNFLEHGYKVIVHGSNEKSLLDVSEKLKTISKEFDTYCLHSDDVYKKKPSKGLFSNVDVLVNAVGGGGIHQTWDMTSLQKWEEVHRANVLLPVFFINNVLSYMKERNSGRIINISSVASLKTLEVGPEYSSAKAGLVKLSESLAKYFKNTGVTVNCISPGLVFTENLKKIILERYDLKEIDNSLEINRLVSEDLFPNITGRLTEPQEIADLVMYLCSESSKCITGQNIVIDSGYLLSNYASMG